MTFVRNFFWFNVRFKSYEVTNEQKTKHGDVLPAVNWHNKFISLLNLVLSYNVLNSSLLSKNLKRYK